MWTSQSSACSSGAHASYPVFVRLAPLLHASFGPNLAIVALVLRYPSLSIRLVGDFHPQAVEHARHSLQEPVTMSPVPGVSTFGRGDPACLPLSETVDYCLLPLPIVGK